MKIKFESRVTVPEGVLFRELDGESVILNLESENYFGLDEVGTRMWNLLSKQGSIEAACATLIKEYDVDEERLRGDLIGLVEKLVADGLLAIEDG